MADEALSPLPFRRERNLSNRNFNKRNSRRGSTHSTHSQLERHSHSSAMDMESGERRDSNSSSSIQFPRTLEFDSTEREPNQPSVVKMVNTTEEGAISTSATPTLPDTPSTPGTPTADPALLDVRQKVQRFETLKTTISYTRQERSSLKLLEGRHHPSFSQYDASFRSQTVPRRIALPGLSSSSTSCLSATTALSIDEVRSEDELDHASDCEAKADEEAETVECALAETASAVLPSHEDSEDLKSATQLVQRSISADPAQMTPSLKLRNDKQFPR